MKNKLQLEHLHELSNVLLYLSDSINANVVLYTTLHAMVARQLKIKVDKKIASGIIPPKGFTLKVTPVELTYLLDVNKWQLLSKNVIFRNAITRLIALNC